MDSRTLARVATVFEEVRVRAPDLYVPAAGALPAAFAELAGSGGDNTEPVLAALGEWALDAESEPLERLRRDCLRFQSATIRGALRLYAEEPDLRDESLLALQRFVFLQVALLASLAARSQGEGGVVRTLPTPEYAAFMEIFRTAIESHRQEGKQLGLLILDVAKVEQVDRLLGLQRGEAFMLRVIRRMREGVLRKQDQLGRVSRDQFACLLPRIAGEGIAILAANKILGALEAPIPIGDRTFGPDAAIGIAMYPDHGADPQALVRNGKLAVRAARAIPELVAVYTPAHGEGEERNVQYESRLRRALEADALRIVFAPRLDVRSRRIAGLQCVLQWTDEALGEVPEARALEAAESSGLIREVTWWIFNSAFRLCAEFARVGFKLPVSLKVTASGALQADFPEFVERALRTWKVPAEGLMIEIHEAALTGGFEEVQKPLTRLKALGLQLALDGFGSGSTSLRNLVQLPFSEVKIGATLVANLPQEAHREKAVRALAALAKNLGLRVTADGVDDAETAAMLAALGCERVQGGYVGPPLTAQEVVQCDVSTPGPAQLPFGPARPRERKRPRG